MASSFISALGGALILFGGSLFKTSWVTGGIFILMGVGVLVLGEIYRRHLQDKACEEAVRAAPRDAPYRHDVIH